MVYFYHFIILCYYSCISIDLSTFIRVGWNTGFDFIIGDYWYWEPMYSQELFHLSIDIPSRPWIIDIFMLLCLSHGSESYWQFTSPFSSLYILYMMFLFIVYSHNVLFYFVTMTASLVIPSPPIEFYVYYSCNHISHIPSLSIILSTRYYLIA